MRRATIPTGTINAMDFLLFSSSFVSLSFFALSLSLHSSDASVLFISLWRWFAANNFIFREFGPNRMEYIVVVKVGISCVALCINHHFSILPCHAHKKKIDSSNHSTTTTSTTLRAKRTIFGECLCEHFMILHYLWLRRQWIRTSRITVWHISHDLIKLRNILLSVHLCRRYFSILLHNVVTDITWADCQLWLSWVTSIHGSRL